MLFEVGETVVYPHHGAATIIEVKDRIIKGETKKYLKLNVTQGDLIIEVPAGKFGRIRLEFGRRDRSALRVVVGHFIVLFMLGAA